MSPIKRNKLIKIRIELDKLDNYLIKIIKKRTNLVQKVLELKDKKNQMNKTGECIIYTLFLFVFPVLLVR